MTDITNDNERSLIAKFSDAIENYTDIENFIYSIVEPDGVDFEAFSGNLQHMKEVFRKVLPDSEIEAMVADKNFSRGEFVGVLAAAGNRDIRQAAEMGIDISPNQAEVKDMADRMKKWNLDASNPDHLNMIKGLVVAEKKLMVMSKNIKALKSNMSFPFARQSDEKVTEAKNGVWDTVTPEGEKIPDVSEDARAFLDKERFQTNIKNALRSTVKNGAKVVKDASEMPEKIMSSIDDGSLIDKVGSRIKNAFDDASEVFEDVVDHYENHISENKDANKRAQWQSSAESLKVDSKENAVKTPNHENNVVGQKLN